MYMRSIHTAMRSRSKIDTNGMPRLDSFIRRRAGIHIPGSSIPRASPVNSKAKTAAMIGARIIPPDEAPLVSMMQDQPFASTDIMDGGVTVEQKGRKIIEIATGAKSKSEAFGVGNGNS